MEFSRGGMGGEKITSESLMYKDTDMFSVENYENEIIDTVVHSFSADGLTGDGPYIFKVPGNMSQYIKSKDMKLLMEFKITQTDGTALTYADEISFANLPISSLFQTVTVDLLSTPISEITQELYSHKCYLETLLSYSNTSLENELMCSMFYPDPKGFYDNPAKWKHYASTEENSLIPPDDQKFGIWRRHSEARAGEIQVIAPLSVDFFQTNRLLLPNMPFTLTFSRRANNDFFFLTQEETKKYKVIINKFELKVPFVTVNHALFAHHQKLLQTHPAKYKFQKVVPVRKQIGIAGYTEITFDNCFELELPKQIYIMMIDTSAFSGNLKESPFIFRHNNIASLHLKINQDMVPVEPIKYNFNDGQWKAREGYQHFLDQIGQNHNASDTLITYKAFCHDSTIFAFDLSPDSCQGFHFHSFREGRIDIKMQLHTPLTKATTVLVFGVYDKILKLDKNRQISIKNV